MAKKYFATRNLEAVMNMELQLKFCPARSLTIKERVTRIFLLMTARTFVDYSQCGGCKNVIRQRNFFAENDFVIST